MWSLAIKTTVDLLIFDLDGTLVDSKVDITNCVNKALVHHGIKPVAVEVIARYVGTGIQPLLISEAGNHPEVDMKALLAEFEVYYERHLADESQPYPGIIDLLEHFKSKKRIVLTNKKQRFADLMIDQLEMRKYFDAVYGRDAFEKQKPDPLPILEICKRHRIHTSKTVMIGDTDADILSGRGAGAYTCAVTYGYGVADSVAMLRPTFTVDSAAAILDLFV